VSLFMKNRDDAQRADDEKTLVVLSNRLAKVHHLPVWTICAAQQAIESKLGVKNIIADDRLKLVPLLQNDQDYYDIVLNRVREITNPEAIASYYAHYKQRFQWAAAMGEQDFVRFFPFHQPAVEVLRAITYELTTARSAIHFMHQTLKHQIKHGGRDLIRLWELFDEAVRYEEDPSNLNAAIVAIKTKREADYRAYEACRRQIDSLTKGYLKVHRNKAVKTVQTLFLYHIARTRQHGLTPEEVANSVLIERDADATMEENVLHYETLAENLKKELRQIAQTFDEDHRPRYRFDPVFTGVDPRTEFQKARDEAEGNEERRREAWEHLLSLNEWLAGTRQMTLDLSHEVKSIFCDIVPASWPYRSGAKTGDQETELVWKGRQVTGIAGMRDLAKVAKEKLRLPLIDTDQTDHDFACFISTHPVPEDDITKVLERGKDARVLLWSPAELRMEDRERLLDFTAYRKLVADWEGKDTEDAVAVINWVANSLQTELGRIYRIVPDSYARGRIDTLTHRQLEFHVAGELTNILRSLVDRVLTAAYESRDIQFEPPFIFRKEEGVKVINGIVRTGEIPKGVKPNQNISAAQNFGFGLKIIKKAAERKLDVTDNRYVQDLWHFIDSKLVDDGQVMKIETLYKNFMGLGGPKDYGLTRRMVQIYLLCLAREGRIRIGLSPRSGLPYSHIDYANLKDIDFSAAILGALADVQKMARPENWEVLRPYAEKLLERQIPATFDESAIAEDRKRLRELFTAERDAAQRVQAQAKDLFAALGVPQPYEAEIDQACRLFATDLADGDDIHLVLHGLKEAFGHHAFDVNQADSREVDDLANRLRNYRDARRFLGYDRDLRTAHDYCQLTLPEGSDWGVARRLQREVGKKLADLRPFIDSDARLRTELLGHVPPQQGEKGTLGRLIHEYTILYSALHDTVLGQVEAERDRIDGLLRGDTLRACKQLEGITALQPPFAAGLEEELNRLADRLFTCPSPARSSVEDRLRSGPVHDCGLTPGNCGQHVAAARQAAGEAVNLVEGTVRRKLELFLNPGIRQRLEQGRKESLIEAMLKCQTVDEVQGVLVPAVLKNDEAVAVINRYLKRITVKRVRLADFRPSIGTVEREQVASVVREFQRFLEDQFEGLAEGREALPVLQLE
jgi:hypothetical protein